MKSDRETCCKSTSNDLQKLSEDQKLSGLCSEAGLRLVEVGQIFNALASPRGEENQSLCREKILPRDQEGTRIKRWIQSNERFGPVSDMKVCNNNGRYSIEVQVQSLFQDQTVSWIGIVNGIDKFVREAMPIQEEEKASGKPATKARPILKPSSPVEQRQWIDIGTQESNDPYCFHVSKFITRLLRHSQKVYREEDAGVHNDQVVDECKKKLSDNTGYWSEEMKKYFVNVPLWSIDTWISVLAKGGGQKKRFQCCFNPNYPHQILYLRAIQGHAGSTLNPALQDNVLLPEGFTEYVYQVGNGKELRSTVNHGLIRGGVSLRTGRQAVFFTIVNPMDNQDGVGRNPMRLVTSNNRVIQKYLETLLQNTVFWCNLNLAQQRGLQFYQTRSNAVILCDTLLVEFIEKAICMKTKDQLYQRGSVILRPRVVLEGNSQSDSQDLLVQEARSSWESQQDAESCGETRCNTADYRIPGISISTVKLQKARRQNNVTNLIVMFAA